MPAAWNQYPVADRGQGAIPWGIQSQSSQMILHQQAGYEAPAILSQAPMTYAQLQPQVRMLNHMQQCNSNAPTRARLPETKDSIHQQIFSTLLQLHLLRQRRLARGELNPPGIPEGILAEVVQVLSAANESPSAKYVQIDAQHVRIHTTGQASGQAQMPNAHSRERASSPLALTQQSLALLASSGPGAAAPAGHFSSCHASATRKQLVSSTTAYADDLNSSASTENGPGQRRLQPDASCGSEVSSGESAGEGSKAGESECSGKKSARKRCNVEISSSEDDNTASTAASDNSVDCAKRTGKEKGKRGM